MRLQFTILVSVVLFLSLSTILVLAAWSGALERWTPWHAVRALQRPATMHAAEEYARELLTFTENIQRLVLKNELVDALRASLIMAETGAAARLFRPYIAGNFRFHGFHRKMYFSSYVDYSDKHWQGLFIDENNRLQGFVWSHRLAIYQTQLRLLRAINLNASHNFVLQHFHYGETDRDFAPTGFNPLAAGSVNVSLLNHGFVGDALRAIAEPPSDVVYQLNTHINGDGGAGVDGMRAKLGDWAQWENELLDATANKGKGVSVSFGNVVAVIVRALYECGVLHAMLAMAVVIGGVVGKIYYSRYASLRREIDQKAQDLCDSIERLGANPTRDDLLAVVKVGLALSSAYANACRVYVDAPDVFNAELLVRGGTTRPLLRAAMALVRERLLPRLRVAFRTTRDVVVSFAGEEEALALQLQTSLERSGVSVFVVNTDVVAGAEWPSSLHAALVHANCGVAFLSRNYVLKGYPLWELMLLMARFHEQTMLEQRASDTEKAPLILVRSVAWERRDDAAQAMPSTEEAALSGDAVTQFLRPLVACDSDLPYFARESVCDSTRNANECATKVGALVLGWRSRSKIELTVEFECVRQTSSSCDE